MESSRVRVLPFDCWALVSSYCEASDYFSILYAIRGLYEHVVRLNFPTENTWFKLKTFPHFPKSYVRRLHYNETCNELGRFSTPRFRSKLRKGFPNLKFLKLSGFGYFEDVDCVVLPQFDFLEYFELDMRSKPITFRNTFPMHLQKCPKIRCITVNSQIGLDLSLLEKSGAIDTLKFNGAFMTNREFEKYFFTLKSLHFETNQYMTYKKLPILFVLEEIEIIYSYKTRNEVLQEEFPSEKTPNLRTLKILHSGSYFSLYDNFAKRDLIDFKSLQHLEHLELTGPLISAIDKLSEKLVIMSNNARILKLVTFEDMRIILNSISVFSKMECLETNLFLDEVVNLGTLNTLTTNYSKNLRLINLPKLKFLRVKDISNSSFFRRIDNSVRTSVQKLHLDIISENVEEMEITDYTNLTRLVIKSNRSKDSPAEESSLFSVSIGPNVPSLHHVSICGSLKSLKIEEGANLYDFELTFYEFPVTSSSPPLIPLSFDRRIRLQNLKITNSGRNNQKIQISFLQTREFDHNVIKEEEPFTLHPDLFQKLNSMEIEGVEIREFEGNFTNERLPNLKFLTLKNYFPSSSNFVKKIENLTHLESLKLFCWDISPELTNLIRLKDMEVSPNPRFHEFCNFQRLRKLKIVTFCGGIENNYVRTAKKKDGEDVEITRGIFEGWILVKNNPELVYCSYLKVKSENCPKLKLKPLW